MLAIIALLSVAASPTFVRLMRDRRVNRAAMQLVDYLRTARTMAIGRGQPILVTWNAAGVLPVKYAGGTGYLEIDEPIVTNNAAATLCSTTLWHTASTQMVTNFDLQNGKYEYAAITFYDDTGATPGYAEFCFSNTGRMYLRTGAAGAAAGAFHAVLGVPSFAIFNTDNNPSLALGAARWVFAPPNGAARMGL